MKRYSSFGSLALVFVFFMVSYADASSTYKIGLLVPLSGAYANEGKTIRDGFLLKLKEANYRVGDTKIEVIVEDTEAKPAVGVTKARKLVEKDRVDILTGCYSSAVGLAVRDYVHEQKVPHVILGGSVALALSYEKKSPYVYRCSTAAGQYLAGFAEYLYKDLGYRKGAAMAPDYAYGHDLVKVFTKDFTRLGGKVLQTTFVPFPTLDFAPYLSKVDPQAEFLYGEFAGSDAVRLVKQYKDYGMWKKMPLVGGAIVMQELLEAEGDSAIGIVGAMFYSTEIDNPENRAFVKAFMAEYKQVATALAASSYEGGTAILMALKEIEKNIHDREAFLKALAKVNFPGPRGPFSFEGETNNVIHNNYILKVVKKDGRLVLDVLKTYPGTRASQVKALLAD